MAPVRGSRSVARLPESVAGVTAMLPVGLVAWRSGSKWTLYHFEWHDENHEPRHMTPCGKIVPKDERHVTRVRKGPAPLCKRCLVALDRQAAKKLELAKSGTPGGVARRLEPLGDHVEWGRDAPRIG